MATTAEITPNSTTCVNLVQEISFPDFKKAVLADPIEFRKSIHSGIVYIIRKALPEKELMDLRKKVHRFGQDTDSTYHKILEGTPNFHQIVDEIKLYKILMRSHNYYFFCWNSNPWNIFSIFKETLDLFQIINGHEPDHFEKKTPKDLVVTRLQIQHYPSGGGYMAEHNDPTEHVKTIMIGCMSQYGKDYFSGGLYFFDKNNNKLFLDSRLEIGDMVLGFPPIPHGVVSIEPNAKLDWTSEKGRWMVLFNNLVSHYGR